MRRSTVGVKFVGSTEDSLDARIARAEAHDPERIVRILEPMVTEPRRTRLRDVIAQRLASVSVVFDRPYDPHNGAAIVRSCEAFGVQRLHVIERSGVKFALARSVARGAEKWVDVVHHASTPSALAWAEAAGILLVGADPGGELGPEDLSSLPRVALVVGNERDGIAPDLAAACAVRVRVPMRGFIESLNVSVTAAILLHAATRGRPGDLDAATRRRLYARGLYLSVVHAEEVLSAM